MAFKKGNIPWIKGKKIPYKERPKAKGQIPWNKGLTKDINEKIKMIGRNTSKTRKQLFKENIKCL